MPHALKQAHTKLHTGKQVLRPAPTLPQAKDFAAAAALAFELRQARRLLSVADAALQHCKRLE